jgi:hypothetical protein
MMKTYRGYTDQDYAGPEPAILVYEEDHPAYKLRHLIVHSPSGLAWGFGGSGPADLALAILADLLGEADAIPAHERYDHDIATEIQHTRAWTLHQDFKWRFITPLDQGLGWTITEAAIRDWLAPRLPEIERAHRERQALALIGHRVELDDSGTADVMDVDGDDLRLIVSPLSGGAWFRVELPRVACDRGLRPDDDATG